MILVDRGMIRVQISSIGEISKHKSTEISGIIRDIKQILRKWHYGENGETVEDSFVRKVTSRKMVIMDEVLGGMCSSLLCQANPSFPVKGIIGEIDPLLKDKIKCLSLENGDLFVTIRNWKTTERRTEVQVGYGDRIYWMEEIVQTSTKSSFFQQRIARQVLCNILAFLHQKV